MTYAEAAAVTDIGTAFAYKRVDGGWTFNEFEWFVGLTELHEDAFRAYQNNTMDVTSLRSLKLPPNIQRIKARAIIRTQIRSIVIPEGCTSIGSEAMNMCHNLVTVDFPSTLRTIDTFCIGSHSLQTITIRRKTSPTLQANSLFQTDGQPVTVYVPFDADRDSYNSSVWQHYLDRGWTISFTL